MDTRRDHGEYYPGGGTRQGAPSAPGGGADASGKVDRVDLGVIADDASASEMRTAIQRIQRAMRPAVTVIAVLCGALAAEARTNAWDKLRGGAAVVVEEEDEAALAEIAAATNALAARIADATNGVVAALPPQQDLEPYATKAALAAATNAVMAAMPASANLEPYATKVWVGQQNYVTDAFLGTNFATKAWVNALGFVNQAALDTFEGTVEARVGVVENAVAGSTNGLASKAWVEGKGYVTASVTNGLAKRAWVTEQNDAAKAHADGKLEEAKAYSDANRESAKEYARNLAWAASEGMTRLVTNDGRTWQDATGTVWQVSDVWGWTGTAWTNNVSLPVTFYPDGSGTNWVSNIVGMRRLVTDGGEVPYVYLRDDNAPDLSHMADAMGKATDTNLTWEAISPLLGVMQGCSVQLYKAVVALQTNAVRQVAYTDTQGGGGGNASSSEESQRLVTQDGNQWMDASGCVWRVDGVRSFDLFGATWLHVAETRWEPGTFPAYLEHDGQMWILNLGSAGVYTNSGSLSQGNLTLYVDKSRYYDDYFADSMLVPIPPALQMIGRVALTNDVPSTPGDIGAAPASVADTVQAWQTYWDGDDVRVTVTNYYGSIDIPHLYIEQKMPSDDTHDAPWFKTIWDEMTRHQQILQRITEAESAIAEKADRAWGFYDSHTGEYSPDGYTQISSSNILIAAGMAYQKTITTDGEVWVLTATDPTTVSEVTSNGFFRISDGDGNSIFEIVKGDKRTVGATAGGITVDENFVHITYSVVSDDPPQIEMTQDLRNGNWSQLSAAVSWTGQSGAWVAHVEKPNQPRAFFRATYRLGSETYIKNSAPVGFERVYIGGQSYRVAVETINGKKLMVLYND